MEQRLVIVAKGIVLCLAWLIALFVTVTSYLYRINNKDMSTYADEPFKLLAVMLISFMAAGILAELTDRMGKKAPTLCFWLIFCIVMTFCAWWTYSAKSLPARDAKSIYDIALRIIAGDLGAVQPKDSYLSLWPFQSGFLLYVEMVLRFIPLHGYTALCGMNMGFMGLSIISLYNIVKKWSANRKTVIFWCALILFCTPYLLYVNFLYNDVPSIACIFFATWMMTEYLDKKKNGYLLLSLIAAGISVMLRNNSLIFVIAALLLMAVTLLISTSKDRKRILLTAVLLLMVSICASQLPQSLYEHRAGNKIGEGVPPYSYIAMGLQDTGRIPGWNNGYHVDLLIECNYDSDLASQISRESIKASLKNFLEHPAEIFKFFYAKTVPEWCDENFSCLYSTSELFADRSWTAQMIYDGIYTPTVLSCMNFYQSILYTGFLLYCFDRIICGLRRRKLESGSEEVLLWRLVLLVTIIGGFLFMMIWEGGSRYTMPYMVMMTPYAAMGFSRCWEVCISAIQRLKRRY